MAEELLKKAKRGLGQAQSATTPLDNEAEALDEKNANIREYQNATRTAAPAVNKSTAVTERDKINPNAKYGDRPGEKRIDVSNMTKPLGQAAIYDEGGPVEAQPEDDLQAAQSQHSTLGNVRGAISRIGKAGQGTQNDQIGEAQRQAMSMSNAQAAEAAEGDLPVMDEGGEIDNRVTPVQENQPDVNDGDHQMAVLENGERVLTPQQNAEYEKDQHGFKPMGQAQPITINIASGADKGEKDELDVERAGDDNVPVGEDDEKHDVDGKQIPVYDEGGEVTPAPAATTAPADSSAQDAQPVEEAVMQPPTMTPGQHIDKAVTNAKREQINDHMTEAALKGDIVGLGLGAVAHNQLDKHEQRMGTVQPAEAAQQETQPEAKPGLGKATQPPAGSENWNNALRQDAGLPVQEVTGGTAPTGPQPTERTVEQNREAQLKSIITDPKSTPMQVSTAREQLAQLKLQNPLGSKGSAVPGLGGKILHDLQYAVPTEIRASIPSTATGLREEVGSAQKAESGAARTELEQAQARLAGMKSPADAFYLYAMHGGKDGSPAVNPDTEKPYTPEEALIASKGEGTATDTMGIKKLMREHPDWSFEEASQHWFKDKSGQRLTDKQRQIADYISAHNLEDTPQNRDQASQEITRRDAEIKEETQWPWTEKKERFQDKLQTARTLLVQNNADSYQRGLKADELQQTENARDTKIMQQVAQSQQAIDAADDEQLAANISPLLNTLAVVSIEGGVKRLNQAELAKFMPTNGSLFRWAQANVDHFLSGQIPTEYRQEAKSMLARMAASEMAEHVINTQSIDSTIRQGAQTPVTGPAGATGKKEASQPKAPEEKKKAPQAETYTAPKKDDIVKTGTFNNKSVFQLKNGKTVYADGSPLNNR